MRNPLRIVFRKFPPENFQSDTKTYQVVTGFFEIGREDFDGRNSQFYLNELQKLLNAYPNAFVYHNFLDLSFQLKFPKANFNYIELSSLPLFKYYSEITAAIGKIGKDSPTKDLVHRIPEYGIVINSKLYLLNKASLETQSEFMIWIDAGISRFLTEDELEQWCINLPRLNPSVDGIFQIDIQNWLRQFKLEFPPSKWIKFNSSTRVISGGAFVLRRVMSNSFSEEFDAILMERLSRGFWDTEQMFYFYLLKKFKIKYAIQKINQPISIFASINKGELMKYSLFNGAIRFFLPKKS
jgi:hypothetical protein